MQGEWCRPGCGRALLKPTMQPSSQKHTLRPLSTPNSSLHENSLNAYNSQLKALKLPNFPYIINPKMHAGMGLFPLYYESLVAKAVSWLQVQLLLLIAKYYESEKAFSQLWSYVALFVWLFVVSFVSLVVQLVFGICF